ncbi:MAG: tetratricopeptide repeat protein [Candidatus Aminicenantes bacterium]|nr:tetratricopeptide repeat protein [Candidatus Aminicenantes bacterium]
MNKKFVSFHLLIAFLAFFLSACSSTSVIDQVKFGVWASEKNLWDEAVFRWKKALLANPNSVAAHNNLAVAFEKKGLVDDALKEYEAALKLEPDNSYVKSNYQNCKENSQPPKKEKEGKKDKNEKK